jgi:hypothetical protein
VITYYRLEGDHPVPCHDVGAWRFWFETTDRTLARDELPTGEVSTVFLGSSPREPPLLWESQVFGGLLNGKKIQYASADEARAGHAGLVARVQALGLGAMLS